MSYKGDALDLLGRIPVVEFDQNAERPFASVSHYIGLIAQDLFQVAPWTVNTQGGQECLDCLGGLECKEHSTWHVRPELLSGMFVKGFQEIEARLKALEA